MSNEQQQTFIILSPAFPAHEADSVWLPSKQLFVKKLKENFPAIHIIVLSFNYPQHNNTYSWNGVQVIAFNGLHKRKFSRLLLWARVWRRLKQLKREHSIIGIYSFWCGECALVGRHFARRNGIKHFCWISGMDAKKENRLIKLIRPRAGELVAMSTFLVNEFYTNHSIRPRYAIPIGIDPSEFNTTTGERDIDILGVGSLSPFKQYDLLILLMKKLVVAFPNIKAVICGGGSEMAYLQQLVKDLHLENTIQLTGEKSHAETLELMQRAKVFIHPSAYEGFGAVNIEALYAGAYVISFCDPMQLSIDRWYIARTITEMEEKAIELLASTTAEYKPVLVYSMDDTAKSVMQLFTKD